MTDLDTHNGTILLHMTALGGGNVMVSGELDIATGPLLASRVSALLADAHRDSVLLDLSEVWFIDCAGLGSLLAARAEARRLGKQVEVGRAGAPVRRFLERTDAGRSLLRSDAGRLLA